MKKVKTVTLEVKLDAINSNTLAYRFKAKLFIYTLRRKGYKAYLTKSNCIIIDSSLPNKVAKKIIDLGYSKGLEVDIY